MKALIANDFGRWRGLEVVRGWLVLFLILSLFAAVSLSLWVFGGTVALLLGLVALTIVVSAYVRSSTR